MRNIYIAVGDDYRVAATTSLRGLLKKIGFKDGVFIDNDGGAITKTDIKNSLSHGVALDLYYETARYDWVFRITKQL